MTAPTKPDWAHALAGSLAADVTLAYHHSDGMRDAVHAIASALRSVYARGCRDTAESAPCLVARPGELTYECRVDAPCRVCAWRVDAR